MKSTPQGQSPWGTFHMFELKYPRGTHTLFYVILNSSLNVSNTSVNSEADNKLKIDS